TAQRSQPPASPSPTRQTPRQGPTPKHSSTSCSHCARDDQSKGGTCTTCSRPASPRPTQRAGSASHPKPSVTAPAPPTSESSTLRALHSPESSKTWLPC